MCDEEQKENFEGRTKPRRSITTLVEGAQAGLTNKALYQHVVAECHKATSKHIVKASLLTLSDPDLKDSNILHTIYALAIKHRLDPASMDYVDEQETAVVQAPKKIKSSTRRAVGDQVLAS